MIDKIGSLQIKQAAQATKPTRTAEQVQKAGSEFSGELDQALSSVRGALEGADKAAVDALVGNGQPHTAMIAMTKADLALRFVTQTRNKAIEAYREIMNLQL